MHLIKRKGRVRGERNEQKKKKQEPFQRDSVIFYRMTHGTQISIKLSSFVSPPLMIALHSPRTSRTTLVLFDSVYLSRVWLISECRIASIFFCLCLVFASTGSGAFGTFPSYRYPVSFSTNERRRKKKLKIANIKLRKGLQIRLYRKRGRSEGEKHIRFCSV